MLYNNEALNLSKVVSINLLNFLVASVFLTRTCEQA